MSYCAKSPFQIPDQLNLKHLIVFASQTRGQDLDEALSLLSYFVSERRFLPE